MFAMTAKGLVPVRDREERVLAQAALDVPGTVLTI